MLVLLLTVEIEARLLGGSPTIVIFNGCLTTRRSGSTNWQWGQSGSVRIYVGEAANSGKQR